MNDDHSNDEDSKVWVCKFGTDIYIEIIPVRPKYKPRHCQHYHSDLFSLSLFLFHTHTHTHTPTLLYSRHHLSPSWFGIQMLIWWLCTALICIIPTLYTYCLEVKFRVFWILYILYNPTINKFLSRDWSSRIRNGSTKFTPIRRKRLLVMVL